MYIYIYTHIYTSIYLSCVSAHRVASVVYNLFATVLPEACQASLSGGSPGKNTGVYWSILVAIPF